MEKIDHLKKIISVEDSLSILGSPALLINSLELLMMSQLPGTLEELAKALQAKNKRWVLCTLRTLSEMLYFLKESSIYPQIEVLSKMLATEIHPNKDLQTSTSRINPGDGNKIIISTPGIPSTVISPEYLDKECLNLLERFKIFEREICKILEIDQTKISQLYQEVK